MKKLLCPLIILAFVSCQVQSPKETTETAPAVSPGAYQTSEYLPLLQGKKIALYVNHTSLIGQTHLADSLISLGIDVTKVFTPEHGFSGNKSDGEIIEEEESQKPFELISLYGQTKKPTDKQMENIDLLIVDIQEVGVRFYTYSSTMSYLMEACAQKDIPVIIFDRPNPNGSYVDGPVLDPEMSSFVGLHPIPLVHGLTIGELALMINGEGWLEDSLRCDVQVIKIQNWDHNTFYSLPVKPSPNLPNDLSIALYPSLALFEGTVVSVGRGTNHQFQVAGHPDYPDTSFSFVPAPNEGSAHPPLEAEICYGIDLSDSTIQYGLSLKYLIQFYEALNGKTEKPFFNTYFKKLAGTEALQKQIEQGWSEEEIRKTWQKGLNNYNAIRSKYLLYD